MGIFKGYADLQTPPDLVAKLEHDLARMRADPNDTYAAFDFFVTAEHVVDWTIPDTPSRRRSDEQKAKRCSSEILKIVSHLASGAKHFEAVAKHHESVGNVKHEMGGFDPRAFSPRFFQAAGINVTLENGMRVSTLVLAEDVLKFWKQELSLV